MLQSRDAAYVCACRTLRGPMKCPVRHIMESFSETGQGAWHTKMTI